MVKNYTVFSKSQRNLNSYSRIMFQMNYHEIKYFINLFNSYSF
jgi:hypothetical protein